MIDHAQASVAHIDERLVVLDGERASIEYRLERIEVERRSLEALRDAWWNYIQLHGGTAASDQPAAVPSPPGDGSPAPTDEGARAAAEAASPPPSPKEPSTGGGIESPGSARSGQRERRRHGRRAPAADVATAPSTSLSGPVGTPTPASTPRELQSCAECDWTGKALGVHRRHRHGYSAAKPGRKPKPAAPPVDPVVERRRRAAAEASPRAAVVKRIGDQVQCPSCKDMFVDEAKLRRHREISHGLRADGHSESFLCSRCSAGFPDRDARDAHQATHPPDALGPNVGRDPFAQRDPTVAGVPIA